MCNKSLKNKTCPIKLGIDKFWGFSSCDGHQFFRQGHEGDERTGLPFFPSESRIIPWRQKKLRWAKENCLAKKKVRQILSAPLAMTRNNDHLENVKKNYTLQDIPLKWNFFVLNGAKRIMLSHVLLVQKKVKPHIIMVRSHSLVHNFLTRNIFGRNAKNSHPKPGN